MNPLKIFAATLFSKSEHSKSNVQTSIYNITIKSLSGEPVSFSDFKGKYILIVNVASKCGFTTQYKQLQELHELYGDKLQVIGVPCNQFGNQEPGDSSAIESFCEINYGATFLITEKVDVKGNNQHPLYKWLTQKNKNGKSNSTVKWNFQKYLVNKEGYLADYYFSTTSPLAPKIVNRLK
ncbi:glutathione peroxidase [Changchengzhania lutea]|uniref:glutathione peroxidase n=1 Tax=Changchengzhania lutea TaxID=2049305 RepID=UPI00115EDEF8|nr:glutathione peroxidase [Changchengzhania lutea]